MTQPEKKCRIILVADVETQTPVGSQFVNQLIAAEQDDIQYKMTYALKVMDRVHAPCTSVTLRDQDGDIIVKWESETGHVRLMIYGDNHYDVEWDLEGEEEDIKDVWAADQAVELVNQKLKLLFRV